MIMFIDQERLRVATVILKNIILMTTSHKTVT